MNGTITESEQFNLIIQRIKELETALTLPYLCDHCRKMVAYNKYLLDNQLQKLTEGD